MWRHIVKYLAAYNYGPLSSLNHRPQAAHQWSTTESRWCRVPATVSWLLLVNPHYMMWWSATGSEEDSYTNFGSARSLRNCIFRFQGSFGTFGSKKSRYHTLMLKRITEKHPTEHATNLCDLLSIQFNWSSPALQRIFIPRNWSANYRRRKHFEYLVCKL